MYFLYFCQARWWWVGQNLAMTSEWSSNPNFSGSKANWTKAVEMWYNEVKDYTYGVFGQGNKNKMIGHYTQVFIK